MQDMAVWEVVDHLKQTISYIQKRDATFEVRDLFPEYAELEKLEGQAYDDGFEDGELMGQDSGHRDGFRDAVEIVRSFLEERGYDELFEELEKNYF